jgi:hypothetical protein
MPMSGQPREVLGGGKLKGGIFRSHMQWVRDHRSAGDLQRLLASLSPELQKAMSGAVLATVWYPFAWLLELDRAIVNLFGGGNNSVMRDLGRYSASINLSTTYKMLDRKLNHEFFRNSAILHSQFQDFGKVLYEQSGESGGRMIHTSYPSFSPTFCMSALGYYEGCIESHGGTSARVTEQECQCYGDPSCTFVMTWR